jgi:predicted site-specific integrase-resolvase
MGTEFSKALESYEISETRRKFIVISQVSSKVKRNHLANIVGYLKNALNNSNILSGFCNQDE